MVTKKREHELETLAAIRKMVDGLGLESYIGMALSGALELAEDNIENNTYDTTQYFIEKSWELEKKAKSQEKELTFTQQTAAKQVDEINRLQAERDNAINENEQLKNEVTRLKVKLYDLIEAAQ